MRPKWPFWKHRAPKMSLDLPGRSTMRPPEALRSRNPTWESSHFSGLTTIARWPPEASLNCDKTALNCDKTALTPYGSSVLVGFAPNINTREHKVIAIPCLPLFFFDFLVVSLRAISFFFDMFPLFSSDLSQESPRQTKPKKGPKRKVHEVRPFL